MSDAAQVVLARCARDRDPRPSIIRNSIIVSNCSGPSSVHIFEGNDNTNDSVGRVMNHGIYIKVKRPSDLRIKSAEDSLAVES